MSKRTISAETQTRFEDGENGELFGIVTFGVQDMEMMWEGENAKEIIRILESEQEAQPFVEEFIQHMAKEWLRVKGLGKAVKVDSITVTPNLPPAQGNA
ncbi:MAG: hypothetical protein WB799_04685 [Candidatus Sulfotelmatobacter sp.]